MTYLGTCSYRTRLDRVERVDTVLLILWSRQLPLERYRYKYLNLILLSHLTSPQATKLQQHEQVTAATMSRYPKRKRNVASYLLADVDEADDDDDDWGPAKEVCIDAASKPIDTIWNRPFLTRKP